MRLACVAAVTRWCMKACMYGWMRNHRHVPRGTNKVLQRSIQMQFTYHLAKKFSWNNFKKCSPLFADLSGKVFLFPQESNTAYVRLMASVQDFSSLTVCHRYICFDCVYFVDQQHRENSQLYSQVLHWSEAGSRPLLIFHILQPQWHTDLLGQS